MRLGGPQSQSVCFGEEIYLLPLLGIEPQFVGCPLQNLETTLCHLPLLNRHQYYTGKDLEIFLSKDVGKICKSKVIPLQA
jgi:hypothetical protein